MAKRLRFHIINTRHEIAVFIHGIFQCSQVQYLSIALEMEDRFGQLGMGT